MRTSQLERRQIATGLAFLAPNILGFLAFVLLPLAFSLVMAFSNWDLKLHNLYKDGTPHWVGLDNFIRLFTDPNFWKYLGNTLFLMMAIPFSIGGSLIAAMMLSKDIAHGRNRTTVKVLASVGLVVGIGMMAAVGMGSTAMVMLMVMVAGGVLVLGALGGNTVYRTMFYLPHFTAGVATYILWEKLYNPIDGPINLALGPVLDRLAVAVNVAPGWALGALTGLTLVLMLAVLAFGIYRLLRMWLDGDLGSSAMLLPLLVVVLPAVMGAWWGPTPASAIVLPCGAAAAAAIVAGLMLRSRSFDSPPGEGFGSGLMLASAVMVVEFVLLGLAIVLRGLPAMASDGLSPPQWLSDYHWAKPAIMIMGFWAAVGSNNMLLYLAALTNVPQDLYEAADIDGASRFQRFWNITWPQLAPTTFFIVVMSMIGGLQGGFEMARTMTQGGPAGATTTLSYMIYIEGFETGRLGYTSAIAWTMFLFILLITLFNWKFGSRYVNE